ncbi:MAG: thioredoxin-disulfide reductase [Patescibacteria group bacterium]
MTNQLIIVGSGPAGWTAALYAARATLKPLVIEGIDAGGQLMLTTEVENYPGFIQGIQGPDLMQIFKKQAMRFGAEVVSEYVTRVDFSKRPFELYTTDKMFTADSVIVATGASAMWLGVPGEARLKGRGVSACATCDGFLFKDKQVLVVGGGDAAMEEANFLTHFAMKVIVLVRKDVLKASKIMQERAMKNPKIEFVWNTEVQEVLGQEKMTGVRVLNNKTNEISEISADGLFVVIGHKPNTEIFIGQIELDQKGYVVTKSGSTKTNIEGVFAAGDVADHIYRQAVTAAGTGCMSALDAERWLANRK